MKSRTSLFDKGLFRYLVRRGAVLWALLFVLQFLILAMPVYTADASEYDRLMIERVLDKTFFAPFGTIVFAFVAVRIVFGYMMTTRGTGMIASLPVKREGVFITSFLAGLLPAIAVTVVAAALPLIGLPQYRPEYVSVLLIYFAYAMLTYLAFYCTFTLCAQLTGRSAGILFAFLILNFSFGLLRVNIGSLLSKLMRGFGTTAGSLGAYIPMLRLFDIPIISEHLTGERPLTFAYMYDGAEKIASFFGMKKLTIETAKRLPLAAAAFLLYRKRHMENASDLVSIKPLRPVFKYLLCVLCALITADGIHDLFFTELSGHAEAVCIALLLAIGAFIGYFGALMLMERSGKVFKGHWRGFIITAAVLCIGCFAADYISIGYENRIPDSMDVEYVTLYADSRQYETTLREPENIEKVIALHEMILGEEDGQGDVLHIEYRLTDGSVMRRTYHLPRSEKCCSKLQQVYNTAESIIDREVPEELAQGGTILNARVTKDGKETPIDADAMTELYYSCILPDMEDGRLGTMEVMHGYVQDGGNMDVVIYFDVRYGNSISTFTLRVRVSAVRTIKGLRELGVYPGMR